MSKKTVQEPIRTVLTKQTPFERFKEAAGYVLAVQKASLPKPTKKSVKK
jgi:hypothetical protein